MGIWSSVSLSSLARGVSYGMIDDAIHNLRGHVQVQMKRYKDDPVVDNSVAKLSAELSAVAASPAVHDWTWRVRVPAVVLSEREGLGVTLVGVEPKKELRLSFLAEAGIYGEFLNSEDDKGIVIGKKLAELLQTGVGKRVVIMSQDTSGEVADGGFKVKGIFDTNLESLETGFAFLGRAAAQKLLKLDRGFSEASFVLSNADDLDSFVASAKRRLPGLDVTSWSEREQFVVALVKVQGRFLVFWFAIVVVAIGFGMINTLLMAVFERIREFALLNALGMKQSSIVFQIVAESCVLLMSGIAAGNLLGAATIKYFSGGIDLANFAAGTEHIGAKSVVFPRVIPGDWLLANMLMIGLCVAASLYPAFMATRHNAAEGMRAE